MKRGREHLKFGPGDREKLSVKHITDERMEGENAATKNEAEGSAEHTTDKFIETKTKVEKNDDENSIDPTAQSADQNTDEVITPYIQIPLLGKNDSENTVASTIARISSKDKDGTNTVSLTTEKKPEELKKQVRKWKQEGRFSPYRKTFKYWDI